MTSARTQKNKVIVWNFWQELNQSPNNYESVISTSISDDVAWQGPHPLNRLTGKEALIKKIQEFLKKEFAKSGYYLTNLYLSIREGINYILVELTGTQLYSQAELVELRKKLEKVTGNKVRLYVRSIPEVVVTESGYMSFKELQDKMWKQAETLYHKELKKIIKEGL